MSDNRTIVSNNLKTNSLVIAEKFGKRHKDVLRRINNLETPQEFNERNFTPVKYLDTKGQLRPSYEITRDGFSLLVMGFTGAKAMSWKIKFLEAFNAMEQALATQPNGLAKEVADLRSVVTDLSRQLKNKPIDTEPAEYLNQTELTERWGVSSMTLLRWGWDKYGPPRRHLGGKVVYLLADILAWEDRHPQYKYLHSGEALLTTRELAIRFNVNVGTVASWRRRGYGPKARKIARGYIYRMADIKAFEEEKLLAEPTADDTNTLNGSKLKGL